MYNTHPTHIAIIAIATLLMSSCRTTKQAKSTTTSTTAITAAQIDSAAQTLKTTHKRTTTITYIPMLTPEYPTPTMPNTPEPPSTLIDQLIAQGGGTIIIEQEDHLQQDQTAVKNQTSHQDTTTTQNTQYHETQPHQPRASPKINSLTYLILAATILIIVARCRIKQ